MGTAAYGTTIFSAGAGVVINAEPTTDLGGNQFQITESSRRLLDPQVPIAAYDDDDDSEMEIVSIDYFTGKVTVSEAPVGNVEVDAAYITKAAIAGSNSYSFEIGGDILDDTSFAVAQANGGWRSRCYGLHDVNVSIGRYDDLSKKFRSHKMAREKVYIEIAPGGGDAILRGWFIAETDGVEGDVSALEFEDLSFVLARIDGQQDPTAVLFSFS